MTNNIIKTVHLNTFDIEGGAARSLNRLHHQLLNSNIDSTMLVFHKKTDDPSIISIKSLINKFHLMCCQLFTKLLRFKMIKYRRTRQLEYGLFSVPTTGYKKTVINNLPDVPIINLHWIARFVDYEYFFNNVPKNTKIVWRLSDLNPITGGCHYGLDCEKYLSGCGECPLLGSSDKNDYSAEIWRKKEKIFTNIEKTKLHFVSQSLWMAEILRKSPLTSRFPVSIIPNGIETHVFKPLDKLQSRKSLNLPLDKKIIMYGAIGAITDKRKGFSELQAALKILGKDIEKDAQIVVFGIKCDKNHIDPDTGFYFIKECPDSSTLSKLYSSADVVIAPSIQENLSNVVMESLSCGAPVVAFNIGGMPDMIEHKINGYLAKPYEPQDLAEGIKWIMKDTGRIAELGYNARKKIEEEFSIELCATRYVEFYQNIVTH